MNVAAAFIVLSGSILTAGATVAAVLITGRRAAKNARSERRAKSYSALLAAAGAIAFSAGTFRQFTETQTDASQGFRQLLHLAKPFDFFEIANLLRRDLDPLFAAWSDVWAHGTPEAIALANELMVAATKVLNSGSEMGTAYGPVRRVLRGSVWSEEQSAAYDAHVRRLAELRRDFAARARKETKQPVAELFS